MADLTLRLVKGTELTFGELDANFLSLDSDVVGLSSRLDSLEGGGLTGGASLTISATAPSSPEEGDMWLDTPEDVVRVWDGSVWFEFPTSSTGDSAASGTYGDSDVVVLMTGPTVISLDASPTDGASDDF